MPQFDDITLLVDQSDLKDETYSAIIDL